MQALQDIFSKPIADSLIDSAKQHYGQDLKKHTQHQLERKIQETTSEIVHKEYGNYTIERNQIVKEWDKGC